MRTVAWKAIWRFASSAPGRASSDTATITQSATATPPRATGVLRALRERRPHHLVDVARRRHRVCHDAVGDGARRCGSSPRSPPPRRPGCRRAPGPRGRRGARRAAPARRRSAPRRPAPTSTPRAPPRSSRAAAWRAARPGAPSQWVRMRRVPVPRPSTKRPPDISSRSSAVTAVSSGERPKAQAIAVPSSIRSVSSAAPASASTPRVVVELRRPAESKPAASARRAKLDVLALRQLEQQAEAHRARLPRRALRWESADVHRSLCGEVGAANIESCPGLCRGVARSGCRRDGGPGPAGHVRAAGALWSADTSPSARPRARVWDPRAALTVDRYEDDWSRLAWVQVWASRARGRRCAGACGAGRQVPAYGADAPPGPAPLARERVRWRPRPGRVPPCASASRSRTSASTTARRWCCRSPRPPSGSASTPCGPPTT